MRIENMLINNKGVITVVILALIILTPIGFYAIRDAFSQSAEPFLEMPDPKYKECVRDTEYMRFNHWVLLKELREEVVREGKEVDVAFSDCRDCHSNREHFCNECHNVANVYLDCFGCHYYPESPQESTMVQSSKSDLNAVARLMKAGR
jgi:hypothetical protein